MENPREPSIPEMEMDSGDEMEPPTLNVEPATELDNEKRLRLFVILLTTRVYQQEELQPGDGERPH